MASEPIEGKDREAPAAEVLSGTARTTIGRLPARAQKERAALYDALDACIFCSVGYSRPDSGDRSAPVVVPTLYVRDGDSLLLHGHARSGIVQAAREGYELCVSTTVLDAFVVARAAFHHSANYRSVVAFGRATVLDDADEKAAAARIIVDGLIPGRSAESREASKAELVGTAILRFPLVEASVKARDGPPGDDKPDYSLPVWAGLLPVLTITREAITDPKQEVDVDVPDNIAHYKRYPALDDLPEVRRRDAELRALRRRADVLPKLFGAAILVIALIVQLNVRQ